MIFYKYLFIFALFSIIGWILEVIYRGLTTHKLVNPGFMSGCVLPLYGMGVIILNCLSILINKLNLKHEVLFVFIISCIFLTLLEFICGYISLKYFHVRLWDYRKSKFNFKGFICYEFSIIWGLCGVLYYLVIYPHIDNISYTFINSNVGIFSLGLFLGVFIIDLGISIKLFNRLIKYANEIKENINIEKIKLESRINVSKKSFFNYIYPYVSTNKYLKQKIKELRNKK